MATNRNSKFYGRTGRLQSKPPPELARAALQWRVLLLGIATRQSAAILPPCSRMTRFGWILLPLLILVSPFAYPQSDDPSETFLKAYMTAQQGEKLERDNRFSQAIAKYRFAGSLLEELKRTHRDWQPAIVEYRSLEGSGSILRGPSKL